MKVVNTMCVHGVALWDRFTCKHCESDMYARMYNAGRRMAILQERRILNLLLKRTV